MKLSKKLLAVVADLTDKEKKDLGTFFLGKTKKTSSESTSKEGALLGVDSNTYAVYFRSFQLENFRGIA